VNSRIRTNRLGSVPSVPELFPELFRIVPNCCVPELLSELFSELFPEAMGSGPRPRAKSTVEIAGVCKGQGIGDIADCHLRVTQVLFSQSPSHIAEQLCVCRATLLQLSLEGSRPHAKVATGTGLPSPSVTSDRFLSTL